MNQNFLNPITNESDLEQYEKYLNEEFSALDNEKPTLTAALISYIGRAIKVDCAIGNRLESRSGILTAVGEDFLTLKALNRQEIIIQLNTVKFFTILQNNTKLPHY